MNMKLKRYYVIPKSWYDRKNEITPEFFENVASFKTIREARNFKRELLGQDEDDFSIFGVETVVTEI